MVELSVCSFKTIIDAEAHFDSMYKVFIHRPDAPGLPIWYIDLLDGTILSDSSGHKAKPIFF